MRISQARDQLYQIRVEYGTIGLNGEIRTRLLRDAYRRGYDYMPKWGVCPNTFAEIMHTDGSEHARKDKMPGCNRNSGPSGGRKNPGIQPHVRETLTVWLAKCRV